MTRQLPLNDRAAQNLRRMNHTYIESSENTSLANRSATMNITHEATQPVLIHISAVSDRESTTAIETKQPTAPAKVQSSAYLFPLEPLYNIYSVLNESVGISILQNRTENPFRNCSPTIQFQLFTEIKKIDDIDTTEYTIQTMMIRNDLDYADINQPMPVIPKRLGGDEIYVEWVSSDDPNDMGVAIISDEENGTYRLKFVRPPLLQIKYNERATTSKLHNTTAGGRNNTAGQEQYGRLTIYYDYTCGIGSLFAPVKDRFRRAGEIHLSFNHSKIPRPYIHDFVRPNTISNIENDEEKTTIDLSKYHTVIAFGDSVIMQLVRRFTKSIYWSSNMHYRKNICQCLSNSSDPETALEKFNQWHGPQIINTTAYNNQSVAVIIGSGVWDAMRGCVRSDFNEHRSAIRRYVTSLRTTYPQIDLYWKSPSALMLHRRGSLEDVIDNQLYLQQSRYISDGVIRKIDSVQKALMKELGVPFLDLFDAYYLSAPWSLPGDARHFEDSVSSLLLSYYWPGLNRT
jgi:hypothetical protein